jgi:hypothetical protein
MCEEQKNSAKEVEGFFSNFKNRQNWLNLSKKLYKI